MKVFRVASRANFARFAVVASVFAIVLSCGGGGGKRKPSGGLLITSVAPDSGDLAGGTTVMITGNGFNASTTVSIGGMDLTGLTLFDSKTITGVTQATASTGPVDVVVANDPLTVTLPGGFTYFEAVTLSSISPNFGPVWGGTAVDIYGTGFVAGTSVTIGGTEMLNLIVVSTSQIQGFSPAGAGGGQVDVAATNQNGADVIADGFEYFSPVIIFNILPNSGPTVGGSSITIRGTGFTPDSQVKIGDKALINTVVVNIAEITGLTPPGDIFGPEDVTVTNTSGGFTFDDGFTYYDDVTISNVSPSGGPTAGNIPLTITGTGFVAGSVASIGATPVSNLVVVDDLTITGTVPAGPVGIQDVIVVTPFGTDTLVGGFEYFDMVTISGITPTTWLTKGGIGVTVTGTGFFPGTTVDIGGNALLNPAFIDTSTVVGTVPPGSVGTVNVSVININGTDTLPGAFTYQTPIMTAYDDQKNEQIVYITKGPGGGLWMSLDGSCSGGTSGGVLYFDDGGTPSILTDDRTQLFTAADGLQSTALGEIGFEGTTGVWITRTGFQCGGVDEGIAYLDHNGTIFDKSDDQWRYFTPANTPMTEQRVGGIHVMSGGIWIAMVGGGLAYLDHAGTPLDDTDDQWTLRNDFDGLGMWYDWIRDVYVEPITGHLVMGYDTNTYQFLDFNDLNPGDKISDIWSSSLFIPVMGLFHEQEPTAASQFWMGGRYWGMVLHDEGADPMLSQFDDVDLMEFTTGDGMLNGTVLGMQVLSNGVWVGTEEGLNFLEHMGTISSMADKSDDVWYDYAEAEGLSNQYMRSMYIDGASNFWLGTQAGLNYFEHNSTPTVKTDDTWTTIFFDLPDRPRYIQADPAGGVWVATEAGVVYITDNGTPRDASDDSFIYYTTADGLSANQMAGVYPHPNGLGVWIIGADMSYLDHAGTPLNKSDDTLTVLTPPFPPLTNYWEDTVLRIGPTGGLWIGTEQFGVFYFDDMGTPADTTDDSWTQYAPSDGLPGAYVVDISFDAPDGVWLATLGGVLYMDTRGTPTVKIDDLKTVFTALDSGLADTVTASVLVDDSGNGVWFGTLNGLSFLDHGGTPAVKSDDQWQTYTTADGMISNFVWTIQRGSEGLNWFTLSTQFGGNTDGIGFHNDSGTPLDKSDDFWGRLDSSDGLPAVDYRSAYVTEATGGLWISVQSYPTSYVIFVTR